MTSIPKPMLAQSSDALPLGPTWTYEVKWDGYRSIAVKDGARVTLWSRNQKDLTRDYPGIEAALGKLRPSSFVIDGEIVALDSEGRPSFQALQHRSTRGLSLVYVAFDVLGVGRESLLRKPLEERRAELRSLLAPPPPGVQPDPTRHAHNRSPPCTAASPTATTDKALWSPTGPGTPTSSSASSGR